MRGFFVPISIVSLVVGLAVGGAAPLAAQDASAKIRERRAELERIRRERDALRRRMSEIQGTVHDLSE